MIPFATVGVPSGFLPAISPIPDSVKYLLTEHWDTILIDDILADPRERENPFAKAGLRSMLRVAIRLDGDLVALLIVFSRKVGAFTKADALIGRRIADHVAMAISHQRLPIVVNDGAQLRFHVLRTPEGVALPETMEVPPHLRRTDWEHHLVEDMQTDPQESAHPFAKLGLRASLRIAIRVQGQLTAGVAFYSFTPGVYTEADVVIGRRIAARLAISLMREQGLAASRRADEAAERAARLESRVRTLTEELNARAGFHRVIGSSSTWRQALTQATQVASTDTTVLLLGESGTGKEVVARFIHRASSRKNGPFVALNCAALPEQLLESELFGYERGAFTGAMNARAGKIEQASGGVLFLDEVGEMSPTVQAKFLRVLQDKSQAAKLLGVPRGQFYSLLKRHGLTDAKR